MLDFGLISFHTMPSSNTPTSLKRNTRSNSQSDVTLDNNKVLLEISKKEIINSVKVELVETITALSSRVDKLEKDNMILQKQHNDLLMSTTQQRKTMDDRLIALDSSNRKSSFIIRNFPEDDCTIGGKLVKSSLDAVDVVAKALGVAEETKEVKEAFRLGKNRPHGGCRLIMVRATEKTAKAFLRRARTLKQCESPLNKIYIHEDLPPPVTKKLAEMRKRAYEHRMNHPNEEAFVKKQDVVLEWCCG